MRARWEPQALSAEELEQVAGGLSLDWAKDFWNDHVAGNWGRGLNWGCETDDQGNTYCGAPGWDVPRWE
jgi:hypothetical protein